VLDNYATENLLRARPKQSGAEDILIYPLADATIVERFIWSLAWRASVSTQNFFDEVALGKIADVVGGVLNNGGNIPLQGTVIVQEFEKDVPTLAPHTAKFGDVDVVLIYANRFCFMVRVDGQSMPPEIRELCLISGRPTVSIQDRWDESEHKKRIYRGLGAFRRPRFWSDSPAGWSLGSHRFKVPQNDALQFENRNDLQTCPAGAGARNPVQGAGDAAIERGLDDAAQDRAKSADDVFNRLDAKYREKT
jgi:hypothetical protein